MEEKRIGRSILRHRRKSSRVQEEPADLFDSLEEREEEEEFNSGIKHSPTLLDIKAVAKKPSLMKLLIYIHENGTSYPVEIASDLELNTFATIMWLMKLNEAGFIKREYTNLDRRMVGYSIADEKAVEEAISRYRKLVGRKLYKFISYKGTYVATLKNNPKFLEICRKYGYSFEEGIKAVSQYSRIEIVKKDNFGKPILLRRIKQ